MDEQGGFNNGPPGGDGGAGASAPEAARGAGRDWRQVSKLLEQLPPHAIEAEMSLLGSMLIDPQVVGDVLLVLRNGGDDFFKPANGAIYDGMVELYDRHGALDIVQLHQLLADRNVIETVGGVDYLVELAQAVPSAANAKHFARLVKDKAAIRRLIEAAGDILFEAYHAPEDAQAVLEGAERKIFTIAQQSETTQAEALQALVLEQMRLIEENEGKPITGVPSGFIELDGLTHGFQRGEMLVLAARPSMGKTALALNVAEQMAVAGHPVGVFSLEMGKQQLVQRLLSSASGIDNDRIRSGALSAGDFQKLHQACDRLMEAPLFIDDTPGLTLLQLRAKARRMKQQHEIQAIVVDYLQLMTSGRRSESRQMEISEISRGVKAMARELQVPVLCLSQLNRAAEQREGHRPRMSDLRESGSIEQDADVVMMLHREEYYHAGDHDWAAANEDKAGVAELILAKQRNGPTGTVKLTWVSQHVRFKDYSGASMPGGYYEGKNDYGWGGGGSGAAGGAAGASGGASGGGGHFSSGTKTGPVGDFRDGGGPEHDIPF